MIDFVESLGKIKYDNVSLYTFKSKFFGDFGIRVVPGAIFFKNMVNKQHLVLTPIQKEKHI